MAGLDNELALASQGEEAVKDGLVFTYFGGSCPIYSDREHWKRTCVAEGGDYESAMDLSPRGGREAVRCRTQRYLGSRSKCRSLLMPEPWEGGRKGGEACLPALRLAT